MHTTIRSLLLIALLVVAVGAAGQAQLPPPPPVVPDTDPAVEKPILLASAVRGQHPRLLFTAADIPAMRQRAQGSGKVFFDRLMAYLPVCKAPDHTHYQTDATDGQRQGMWRLPTVALHYVLTGNKQSFDNTVAFMKALLAVDNWETGEERDSGMSAANIMVGAALAYDWLYNDLDPGFREAFRQKLLLQARRMVYGGHLERNADVHYWQQDPQNNHRFHRDAGLALCALAAAPDGPGGDWILSKTFDEIKFIHDWLPPDGTSHESPSYMIFGNPYLVLAMDASDRCFGTHYLDAPFFKNHPLFRMQMVTPGLKESFCYGDSGGLGFINDYLFRCTAHDRLADLQAALQKLYQANDDAFMYSWFSLIWHDPSVTGGSIERLPKSAFFSDLGIAVMRDGWDTDNVGVMFKCGPYGGFTLNRYRNERNLHYINVAHDDPDANMFVLYAHGQLLADDDRYAAKKLTSSHNTLLVNGKGQKGGGEEWTQPLAGVDMTKLAYPVTWKDAGEVVIAEGEAGGMYPDLERYRRSFLWVKSGYLLILDDIRATTPADLTWMVQGAQVEITNTPDHLYRLVNGGAQCVLQVASDCPLRASVVASTAEDHGKPMGLRQLRLDTHSPRWRVATVFDLWNHGNVRVALHPTGPNAATVTVQGPGIHDTWQWQAATSSTAPTLLKGQRLGIFAVAVTDRDRARPLP
jgi:hypothetical protein